MERGRPLGYGELRWAGDECWPVPRPAPVRRVALTVPGPHGPVPTVAWLPDGSPRPPVVLLAHGGSGHKTAERQERFGHRFASAGVAALALDGPFHGERRPASDGLLDYQRWVAEEGAAHAHARMRADWLAALDAATAAGWVDDRRVGFVGMSMGTRYGLAVCAALGPQLRGAALGKFGLTSIPELRPLAADDVIRDAARQIAAPVLWHVQWDDEVFPRDGQLELFDLLASPDKVLRARPGGHAVTRPDDENAWWTYVLDRVVNTPPE